ncbi:MAG TPA: pitrilysin family protein [Actinomycetota bacterium]|jgi:predicted Zn-dependent peptidase|nr:pitrilysin family protein [Actinomycetota bacterium]
MPVGATRFNRTILPSGATIVTEAMSEVRSISIGLWFDVGSRDEPDEIAGTSHFLEHLLFKGTPTRSAKDIADAFDAVGGDVNAFTGKEYTCYYARVLDEDLAMAFDVLSDMVSNSTLDEAELESERKVILEEIAMHEDAPDELVHDLFYRAMWDGHPLGRPVLGFNESVGSVTRDQLQTYRHERYSAPNLVVAAAGHLEHERIVDLVAARFSEDREHRKTLRTGIAPRPTKGVNVHRRPTEQAHIVMGTQGLHRSHDDRHALSALDTVIGGGMSSRLFQEVREKRGLAYAVYSYSSMFADTGTFAVYAGTTPQNAHTVMDIIASELAAVAEDGITPAELERAKGHLRGALVLSSEDPGSRMNRLGRQQLGLGEIIPLDELIARFEALEIEQLKRVAGEILGAGSPHITVVGPFDEDAFGSHAA